MTAAASALADAAAVAQTNVPLESLAQQLARALLPARGNDHPANAPVSGDQTTDASDAAAATPAAGAAPAAEILNVRELLQSLVTMPIVNADASRTAGGSADDAAVASAPATLLADAASAAAAMAGQSAAPAHAAQPALSAPQHVLDAPLGSSAWTEQLGTHLTWLAHQGAESASLKVSPADLGPIEVRIAVHGSDASVWFGAAHPETRSALEQALPRLRELFASQGLALADTGVFREPPRQPSSTPQPSAARSGRDIEVTPRVAAPVHASVGLLDLYA